MHNVPVLVSDAACLAALDATYLLDSGPEEMFDRLTRLAARALNVPTASISLIDQNRLWFKSDCGFDATEVPRDMTICQYALEHDGLLIVTDALKDSRFASDPIIAESPHIRFYAGFSLHSRDRHRIGTFYVIDYVPRTFSNDDTKILEDLARSVEQLIYQRQLVLASTRLLDTMRVHEELSVRLAQAREEIEHSLHYDGLTGLPNRTKLVEKLSQSIRRWKQARVSGTIAYIDLDAFRNLNIRLGYRVADKVLLRLGQRLINGLSASDTVAIIGSDEFVMVLDAQNSALPIESILARIAEEIRQPLLVDGHEISIGCTIGFASYPHHGDNAGQLLVAANTAMHEGKAAGRGTVRQYHPALTSEQNNRFFLESSLRHALQNNELSIHYQPKVNLRTGRIVGVEALARWQHPEQGSISPAQFIPLAEVTGLIVPIGEWILHTACQQVRAWADQGLGSIPVAVNLSSRQFLSNDFVASVDRAMRTANLTAGMLELELTESLSMQDPERSVYLMGQLRNLGVEISIDDFGTGYSSLSYLKRLPVDKIKIDRSFVVDMTENAESLSMVQAIIAMAHRLSLRVVAEGVETEKQLAFLALNMCDEMQGYLFSKPLPAEECTALLASGRILSSNQNTSLAIAALFSCR